MTLSLDQWLLLVSKKANLLSKQNVSEIEEPLFASELRWSRDSYSLNGDPP